MAHSYRQDLVAMAASELALPYELVTGKSVAAASKAAMVSSLDKAFDRRVVGCHAGYLAGMPTEQKMAVEEYRGEGSSYMNSALRSGRMRFKMPDPWRLHQVIAERGITTVPADVRAFAKSPGAFAQKMFDRSGLTKALVEVMKDAAAESLHRWKLMADLIAAIGDAPPRDRDTVLWRGEHTVNQFRLPDGKSQRIRLAHGNQMKALKPGDSFARPDMSSFSISPVVAAGFAGASCCMYRLLLPKDAPALFMESYTRPREYEVILAPGTRFRVLEVRQLSSSVSSGVGMTVYELRVMG